MEQIGYGKHITQTVKKIPYGEIIKTGDIAERLAKTFALPHDHAKTLTNNKLKRMADKGEIKRLQKGFYSQVKQTVFGKITPGIDQVMKKTLMEQDGGKIGYESGPFLLNRLGLTTLIPRDMEITTNRNRAKLPEGCRIKIKKPVTAITGDNWKYLQFIDLVSKLPQTHTDAEKPELLLVRYAKMQELDDLTLIATARRYYPKKVLPLLIDLLLDTDNEHPSG